MRKWPLLGVLVTMCAGLSAQTLITLEEDDIPDAGKIYMVASASPLIVFDGEDTGADFNWDFSWLTAILEDTTYWVEDNETNPIYFFLWLTSDIAEQGVTLENDFVTLEDVYYFYEKNDERFAYAGFAGTIMDIPLPIWFEETETILELPATYGQTTSSVVGFDIDIPDIGGWSEVRERSNEIDGWGTITTPSGSYDVLRMRSEILVTDTFSYDGTVLPLSYTTTEYRWMAKEEGMPVLQITTQEILGVETITSVTYKIAELTAIEASTLNGASLVIPQPVHEQLHVQMVFNKAGNYDFLINSVNGQTISCVSANVPQGSYTWTQGTGSLAPGMYIFTVLHNGQIVGTETFMKD